MHLLHLLNGSVLPVDAVIHAVATAVDCQQGGHNVLEVLECTGMYLKEICTGKYTGKV